MKTYKLLLGFILIALCQQNVYAQQDSSELDLGRIHLKKEFTEHITIKRADLEKLPFTGVPDLVRTWFYTFYGNNVPYRYIVDGNIVFDISALSIYDIEEITLVQNALAYSAGAAQQQPLVIITTNQHAQSSGITVAGKSFLTSQNYNGTSHTSSKVNLSHQYYVQASHISSALQYGLSAEYVRTVGPSPSDMKVVRPNAQNTFRLNGSVSASLSHSTELSARIIYASARGNSQDIESSGIYNAFDQRPVIQGDLKLETSFLSRFKNKLMAAYLYADHKTQMNEQVIAGSDLVFFNEALALPVNRIAVQDVVSYHAGTQKLSFDPMLQLGYNWIKENVAMDNSTAYPNQPISYSYHRFGTDKGLFQTTPSFNLSYSNLWNLQGGLVGTPSPTAHTNQEKLFPFLNVSADLLKAAFPNGKTNFKIYGSYAKSKNFNDQTSLYEYIIFQNRTETYVYTNAVLDSNNSRLQTGAALSLDNNRYTLQYNFEKSKFHALGEMTDNGQLMLQIAPVTTQLQSIAFKANLVQTDHSSWQMQINTSSIKSNFNPHLVYHDIIYNNYYGKELTYWTGGWANRIAIKNFSAGLDLLYMYHSIDISSGKRINAFSIQNVYAGYRVSIRGIKASEFYFSMREPYMNQYYSHLVDGRRYFGLGFKMQL